MNPQRHVPTRRGLLRAGAAAVLGASFRSTSTVRAGEAPSRSHRPSALKFRPDLLDPGAPGDLEIIQITTVPDVPACHVYMEAQVFTPDSRRFVLHRFAHPHGSDRNEPRHQYLLCDVEDGFTLYPLTDEPGTTGPSVSPDGQYLYYFVDQTGPGTGPLALKRVRLDGTDRRTLLVIDSYLPGTRFRPSKVYSLSTISSDGGKLAISSCLDDTRSPVEYGLMVFDLRKPSVEVVLHGPTFANVHPQYCRSTDPALKRDILIQENHGHRMGADGRLMPTDDKAGLDIHVIRDDGSHLRDMPWGRDGREYCEGHQCWRGRSGWGITSVGVDAGAELIEGFPTAPAGHRGAQTPGGVRNLLSRGFTNPKFHHFAVDIAGDRLITDYAKAAPEARIYLARLGGPGHDPLSGFLPLARPNPSGKKTSHTHPFLSPDGRMAFFNSDETGQIQAYAIRGLPV